ncbi:MAG TPA: hypothetical protein VGG28_28280 [Kofleriaceae bacterium]
MPDSAVDPDVDVVADCDVDADADADSARDVAIADLLNERSSGTISSTSIGADRSTTGAGRATTCAGDTNALAGRCPDIACTNHAIAAA